MSEREPEGARPAAQGWYARMERQSVPPPSGTPPQSGTPPTGGAPPGGTPPGGPPTAVLPTRARPGRFRRQDRRRTSPPGGPKGRPPGRKGNRDLVWWALGALVLGAAAVVAILLGDDPRGTSAAGAEATATDRAGTTEPTSPSADGVTETPTGTTAPTTGSPTASSAVQDPLGLGVPMTPPACDGTWIVIIGSAIDPATYPADVSAFLATDSSAKYVLTAGQCPSLRQQTPEGNQIYAVYLGPYANQAAACSVSTGVGDGAYVKRMDATTPPEQTWEC